MEKKNIILLNGKETAFEPGETILDAARRNHVDIPTLCHLKGAASTGACRVCVVEVEGAGTLLAACSTFAAPGMVVRTESPKVVQSRKATIELLLASGNHNCAVRGGDGVDWTAFQLGVQAMDKTEALCPVWGDCRLQELAYKYQVNGERYPKNDTCYPVEEVNPFIVRDFSRCILCGRCAQACNQIQVNNAISFGSRGAEHKIIADGDFPLATAECVFCGECVQACPVGALTEKKVRYRHRPWEVKKVRTTCSYCGVGCQLELHVKDNTIVKVQGADIAPNHGSLCVKGRFGYDFVGHPDRLTKPLIKENGKHREAGWDEALDLVAKKLSEIKAAHGPDSMGVLTSARITNEENYVAQKFARAVLGTNNVDHCARL
jgi:predicted molibdopterin-dependent oxidoreductase YjgC